MVSLSDYSFSAWDSYTDTLAEILPILKESQSNWREPSWYEYKFHDPRDHVFAETVSHDGIIVGIAAAGIRKFWNGTEPLVGTVSLVTYVSPDHRGRGLYPALLNRLREAAERLGVAFMVALPNSLSLPSFHKAGYVTVGSSAESIIPVRSGGLIRILQSGPALKEFKALDGPSPTKTEIDRFSSLETPGDTVHSVSDPDFLTHRLSPIRQKYYSIEFVGSLGIIALHGARGRLRESKVLSSTRELSGQSDVRIVRRLLGEKHAADVVTTRFSAERSQRLRIRGGTVIRPASPPVVILSTSVAPSSFRPGAVNIRGIDSHML